MPEQILPRDLAPIPDGTVAPSSALIVDNGDGVWQATPAEVADSALPGVPGNMSLSDNNLSLGEGALASVTSAEQNIAIGNQAGAGLTDWSENVLIGRQAGAALTTPGDLQPASSVMIGQSAGKYLTTDGGSVIIGAFAGGGNGGTVLPTTYQIVAVGRNALGLVTQGVNNTAVGDAAGAQTTVGGSNCFYGRAAGNANTTGGFNVCVGHASGFQHTTGGSNTFIGNSAGDANPASTPQTNCARNVAIGQWSGPVGNSIVNTIAIGADFSNLRGARTYVNNTTKIGYEITDANISGRCYSSRKLTAVNNAAGVTLTTAQILQAILTRSGATAVSDTTPTAAAIVAAIPDAEVDASFELTIINNNSDVLTIVAGSGVTLAGTTTVTAAGSRRYYGVCTNVTTSSEAVTLQGIP